MASAAENLTFPASARLAHARQYQAVYAGGVRKSRGAFVVFLRPNGLPHHRLGLAVGRRVGSAVTRNHVKRLVREAFRHLQHDFPTREDGAYDLIVSARGRPPRRLAAYLMTISELAERGHREWERRERREAAGRES